MTSLTNIDPTTNARFKDLGNGSYSEMISDQVQIFYSPVTGQARAIFNSIPFVNINNAYYTLGGDYDRLEVDFSTRMDRYYGVGLVDPVSNQPLDNISVAGMMLMFKSAQDQEFNEREQARLQALADAEAAAAAAGTTV